MSNTYSWFKHNRDASEDSWIRNLVRKQGHVAGWLWWVFLEQLQTHGKGDVFRRDITDLAKTAMTSNSVLTRVLTEMATEFQGQQKVRWKLVGTELEVEIKKFREKQHNYDSKNVPKTSENQPKNVIDIEEEKRREEERRIDNITDLPLPSPSPTTANGQQALFTCQYSDQGQGRCNEPAAENSKYCAEHKIKVHEQFLKKQDNTTSQNGSRSPVPLPFQDDRTCMDCGGKVDNGCKRCDRCQMILDKQEVPRIKPL